MYVAALSYETGQLEHPLQEIVTTDALSGHGSWILPRVTQLAIIIQLYFSK